jgi:hypothetical protein
MAMSYPPVLINNYLAERVSQSMPDRFSTGFRFFPTSPTDINALTESFPEAANNVFAVYDRMFRMRKSPMPHTKTEQLLYYFYKMAGDPEALIETTQLVFDLLDREDESAEEINAWIRSKTINGVVTFDGKEFDPTVFHNFKIYQLQETRDVINFGTARTFAGNKLIIEYNYHNSK